MFEWNISRLWMSMMHTCCVVSALGQYLCDLFIQQFTGNIDLLWIIHNTITIFTATRYSDLQTRVVCFPINARVFLACCSSLWEWTLINNPLFSRYLKHHVFTYQSVHRCWFRCISFVLSSWITSEVDNLGKFVSGFILGSIYINI